MKDQILILPNNRKNVLKMTIYLKPPVDPASRLSDVKSMKPAELHYVEMEARLAAEGVLNRYRSKGDAFVELIAMHLFRTISKRQPVKAPVSKSDDGEGSLF